MIDPNVVTALAAAGGAILMKLIEKWLARQSETFSQAQKIREELRTEIDRLNTDNIRLRKELDQWKNRYWNIRSHEDDDTSNEHNNL